MCLPFVKIVRIQIWACRSLLIVIILFADVSERIKIQILEQYFTELWALNKKQKVFF